MTTHLNDTQTPTATRPAARHGVSERPAAAARSRLARSLDRSAASAIPLRQPCERREESVAALDLPAAHVAPTPEPAPLEIAFWTLREVEAVVKLKKSAIYDRITRREFPAPVKLSTTVSVWVEAEIRDWMRRAVATRDGTTRLPSRQRVTTAAAG